MLDRKSDLSIEKDKRCVGVLVRDTEKGGLQPSQDPFGAVRYRDGNGEIQHAGSVDEAWDRIRAEHESRKEKR